MSVIKWTEEFADRLRFQRDHRGVDPDLIGEVWSIGSDALLRDVERATADDIATLNTMWREHAAGQHADGLR